MRKMDQRGQVSRRPIQQSVARPVADVIHDMIAYREKHPLPDEFCSQCEAKNPPSCIGELCEQCRQREEIESQQHRTSGIGARHAKIKSWDELDLPIDKPQVYENVKNIVVDFLQNPDSAILALIGTRGTGKTQLGCVAVQQTIDQGKYAKIITVYHLLADAKRRYSDDDGGTEQEWMQDWLAPHLLVVDEIGEKVDTAWTHQMITSLLDTRYYSDRPTILIGNVAPEDFVAHVGKSAADRCNEHGGILVCNWQSFRSAQ